MPPRAPRHALDSVRQLGERKFWITGKLITCPYRGPWPPSQFARFPVFRRSLATELRSGTRHAAAPPLPRPPLTPTRPTSPAETSATPGVRLGHQHRTGAGQCATFSARDVRSAGVQHRCLETTVTFDAGEWTIYWDIHRPGVGGSVLKIGKSWLQVVALH